MPSAMPLLHVRLESKQREKLDRIRASMGLPSEASALRWLVEQADDPQTGGRKKSEKNSR